MKAILNINKHEKCFLFQTEKKKTYMDETSKGILSKESGLSKTGSKDLFDFKFSVWSFNWKQETIIPSQ